MIQSNVIPKLPSGYNIEQSLRFNDDDSAYLSRTPSVAGNRKTWTYSTWVKRGNLGTIQDIFTQGCAANPYYYLRLGFLANNTLEVLGYDDAISLAGATTRLFRDTSSWYHIVLHFNTTQAVNTERFKIFVNGVQATLGAGTFELTYPVQNYESQLNNTTYPMYVGKHTNISNYLDSYLAETHFIDGQALTPDYFGEFDATYGHWKPKKYDGTYGTNGFYLPYSNGGNIGEDSSGNGNHFTATNLSATDIVLDSPTNNFATLNVLNSTGQTKTLYEGNLKSIVGTSTTVNGYVTSTIEAQGKSYFEVLTNNIPTQWCVIGFDGNYSRLQFYSSGTSTMLNGITYQTGLSLLSAGDIIGVASDVDAGTIQFYRNGVALGNQLTGVNFNTKDIMLTQITSSSMNINFGQDSSFAGNKTPQGYTDAKGIGDFYYQPPEGYLALCTTNLPWPTVVPSKHFDVVLDTGANIKTTAEGVFGDGLYWIKDRANATDHQLIDYVRGTSAVLRTPITTIGYETTYFTPTGSSVAWNWKAGGTPVTNTDGTITSQVSANVDAGFSIVGWTDTSSGSDTVGHGLLQTLQLVITKSRSVSGNWYTFTNVVDGSTDFLLLQATSAKADATQVLGSTTFSTIGVNYGNCIGYAFHSVEGYSKIGTYIGNGSADGTFVYCNHKPKYVMIKRTDSTGNWIVVDIERGLYNSVDDILYPNLSNAEASNSTLDVDFTSNGFKLRTTDANMNASGGVYLFYSVAEQPFKFSNAR
jgi:hypothetical protein